MEINNGGDLFDYLSRQNGPLKKSETATIIKQVLSGLTHMAKCQIMHRDLKPENIMLENVDDIQNVTIIDFGEAVRYTKEDGKTVP